MTPNIEDHDLNVKAKRAIEFLKDGDKVKVSVRFRGRELGHTEMVREVLINFAEITSEYGVIDKHPKMEGRNMVMYLSSKNRVSKGGNIIWQKIKMKTHRGAAKRFKRTGTGKIKKI